MPTTRPPGPRAVSAHRPYQTSPRPPKPDQKVRAHGARASAVPVHLGGRPPQKLLPQANTSCRTRFSIFERRNPRISRPTPEPRPLKLFPCQRIVLDATPLRSFSRVTLAVLVTASSFRFLNCRWCRRAQMFVHDSQHSASIALENLR